MEKRNLTLQGKVLVIKTFVIPKLLYKAEIIGIPDIYIKEIEKLLKKFLWDGKQPLINIETCYLSREEGGLDISNIRFILKCLNIRTIYSIMKSDVSNWNIIGKYYL